jgi:NADH dehydrogenase
MASKTSDLHRIVVVGGGAGGLELVTRLGDKLGRRRLADVTLIDKYRAHLWKPLLHEVAAGSMDLSVHEIDFLAQAHWHHFRYRIGELIGLDRGTRKVHLAAYFDEEGNEVTPPRSFPYDTLVIASAARATISAHRACASMQSRSIRRSRPSASTAGS